MIKAKAHAMSELVRTKHFVLMTDTGSILNFVGLDPDEFTDILLLQSQTAELNLFIRKLTQLRKEHADAIVRLRGHSKLIKEEHVKTKATPAKGKAKRTSVVGAARKR